MHPGERYLLHVSHDLALLFHKSVNLRLRLLLSSGASVQQLHVALVERLQLAVFRPQQLGGGRQAVAQALLVLLLQRAHELVAERRQPARAPGRVDTKAEVQRPC